MSEITRVLDPSDPFCPRCGHNRDTSSVSSIDEGNGRKSCQFCGVQWSEDTAEQVRAAILAEREANAIKCDAMKTRTHEEPEEVERGFNAALSRAAAAIRRGSV